MCRMIVAGMCLTVAMAAGAAQNAPTLDVLDWLAGDWEMTSGQQCIEEQWTRPSANMLVGMSRTVRGGKTVSFEFLRIEARPDGIYYVPQPGGRPPVDFKLAGTPGPNLVFENPGHADHLKKILYTKGTGDTVYARIEGENAGKPFAAEFNYKRAPNNLASRCGSVK
jgi:Domain of unknown function (DUF6265)